MLVRDITISTDCLKVTPLGSRYYKVAEDVKISVFTDIGCLEFNVKKGLITNFRSGGPLVDRFVDQIGDQQKALIYLIHDMMYTRVECCSNEHPVSRELADEFLRDGLAWAGMGRLKRNSVYYAVRMFGKSAYEEDDCLSETNRVLFSFHWTAKKAA